MKPPFRWFFFRLKLTKVIHPLHAQDAASFDFRARENDLWDALAWLLVVASIIIKFTYKGRMQAEAAAKSLRV